MSFGKWPKTGIMADVSEKPTVALRRLDPRRFWRASAFWQKLIEVTTLVVVLSALGNWLIDGAGLAAWLEAVSTLAAVLAAMYAGFYAANAWKLETAREARWGQQQLREQASRIAAWPADLHPHVVADDGLGNVTYSGFDGVNVMLRNASDVPVTRVWADVTLVVDLKSDAPLRLHLGASEVVRVLEPATQPLNKYVAADEPFDPSTYRRGNVDLDFWCEISLGFRDAGGRDWERLADGQLILVQDAGAHDD